MCVNENNVCTCVTEKEWPPMKRMAIFLLLLLLIIAGMYAAALIGPHGIR